MLLFRRSASTNRLIPPNELNRMVGGQTLDDFVSVGEHFRKIFIEIGGLRPTDRVLDVGCGCGRMAIPLTSYLTMGSYEGFDIMPEGIDWCRRNITKRFPAFRFQHANVRNSRYNPNGKKKARDFDFPYADGSFDFTLLTSVFTHMLQEDLEHYVGEIVRTLKPSGTAVITFFILNAESERLIETPATTIRLPFPHGSSGIRVSDEAPLENAVAYPEHLVRSIFADSGFIVQEPIHFGAWCGREGTVSYQDVVVSKKR